MFYQPSTIEEALELKAKLGPTGRFLAGGTDLIVMMKKGRLTLDEVVDISQLSTLAETRIEGDEIFIGAACPHRTLEDWPVHVLAQAARTVGGPQIRHRGTVGGNVANASPAGDVSVALLALDADVELISVRGSRRMPLTEFFLGVGKTAIVPDEMILGFRFTAPERSAFYKIGKRNAVAISVICLGVSFSRDGNVRIAVGSVAATPLRLKATEAFLRESGLSAATIEEAARMATEEVRPITDHRGGAEYRRAMAGVLTKRLLSQLSEEA